MASEPFDTELEVNFEPTEPPKGFDPELFKLCQDKLAADHKKRAEKRHKLLRSRVREAEKAKDYLGELPEPPQDASEKIRTLVEEVAKEELPRVRPLKGQNPSVFSPYGFGGSFVSRGGVHGFSMTSRPQEGRIGSSCSSFLPAGYAHCEVGCGFWIQAPSSGTVVVSAQALVSGRGVLFGHYPGWADGSAALEASVSVFSSPDFRRLNRIATRNMLWNGHHSYGFERRAFDLEAHTAGPVMVPVRRADMLWIGAAAVQDAASWGLWSAAASNFLFTVGPIVHNL